MSYQNKDFSFQQEAESLHDSLTPCLTSRIPPGLLLPMHTHLAESLLKSVTLSRLLLSSSHLYCKREKQLTLLHEGWTFCHPGSGCWARKVFMASCRWFPILFCHFFIKFPNSNPLTWAQAPPGQLQVFLSHFSALFVQSLKIPWQCHLTWSTTGVSSDKCVRASPLLIKILCLEISFTQTEIHSLMLSSDCSPSIHRHR